MNAEYCTISVTVLQCINWSGSRVESEQGEKNPLYLLSTTMCSFLSFFLCFFSWFPLCHRLTENEEQKTEENYDWFNGIEATRTLSNVAHFKGSFNATTIHIDFYNIKIKYTNTNTITQSIKTQRVSNGMIMQYVSFCVPASAHKVWCEKN